MKIQILDKTLANMIAAGEVVENPASVVKELVENSIDAGAGQIVVEITGGGITKIEVSDDGCGIEHEDVENAFCAHATSKIRTAEDLGQIASLGFRGEALASISTVSEVALVTKTAEAEIGTRVVLKGGEILHKTQQAANKGTKIVVRNLFFNTPARRKFLRSEKLEENSITRLVERFMLSCPKVKFRYIVDGKIVYSTAGTSLFDNIYAIYGKELAENLIEVNFQEGKYALEGYISRPEFVKPNKTFQISFLNGRMVRDAYMENAIMVAYQDYLMHGNHPVCFLNLKMPFDSVDVNVHPSKQEVKYENAREINLFFISALKTALEKANAQKYSEIFGPSTSFNEEHDAEEAFYERQVNNLAKISSGGGYGGYGGSSFRKSALTLNASPQPLENVFLNVVDEQCDELDIKPTMSADDFLSGFPEGTTSLSGQQMDALDGFGLPRWKIVGVAFSTYILIESGSKLLMIDQHACHERKVFDKLMAELENNALSVQTLMFPYTFTVSTEEREFFVKHAEEFAEMGIKIREFGRNVFKISEVPMLLRDIEFDEFVLAVKESIKALDTSSKTIMKDFLAQTACKSAVQAGDRLSEEEIKALLSDLDKAKALRCPHGRPFVIEFTKRDFEKWFKRIV